MKPALLALTLLVAAPVATPGPGDWPNWRGPAQNGSVGGRGYPTRLTAETTVWKTALPGNGVSTPVIWKSRLYLTTPSEGQDAVMALDPDGKQLWLTRLGAESPARHRTLASSCNASPVTDGQGIYARFRSGRLAALNLDGTVRWQFSLVEKYGPEELYWDQGSSPLVVDDLLIVSRLHHGESWVGAFDTTTGKERWRQKRNYECPPENDNGYATPILFQHQGKKALLIWGSDVLSAHSLADGSMLWSCTGFNPAGTKNWPAIASPVIHKGIAVVPVGRDDRPEQARVHGIRVDGSGDVTATHRVWQRDDLGVFCCSPVEYEGRVYLLRHRGGVVCLDPATGKTLWTDAFPRASSSFYASPVVAGGILYAAREDGTVFAAKVGERFELLSENPMGERILASPTPSRGRLFVRSAGTLFCLTEKNR